MAFCPICGPKLSICCTLLSAWGIVMLALLGAFYWVHSPSLFEDLPMDEGEWKKNNYSASFLHERYEENALNCWIASGIYVLTFLFSLFQQRLNSRDSYEMS